MITCLGNWGICIQHLKNLAEDLLHKLKDCQKMKGYLITWSRPNIPLLLAFFIDLLGIPSILSRSFQSEIIDPVEALDCITKAKERLDLFDKKEFDKLPHVKDLLRRITIDEAGEHMYQNVTLAGFDDAKNQVAQWKSMSSNEICEGITNCLEEENDSKSIFKLVLQILKTEGWIRTDESTRTNLEFADNAITVLLEHFATLLQNAESTVQAAELLNQCSDIIS